MAVTYMMNRSFQATFVLPVTSRPVKQNRLFIWKVGWEEKHIDFCGMCNINEECGDH